MKVLAIANHKGGVGKTATAHALGEVLALKRGRRVLLVDNDPQAGLTGACGVKDVPIGLAEVLRDGIPFSGILLEIAPNLKLAPADLALAPLELSLNGLPGRASLLKDALKTVAADFDLALIDCSPNLGVLTLAALSAADAVLVPTQPQSIDLRGLKVFLEAVAQVRAGLNPSLELMGVLATFYDSRYSHHQKVLEAMRLEGIAALEIKIGRSVRVADAAEMGKSVVTSDPKNPQAENYRRLADFVEGWLEKPIDS